MAFKIVDRARMNVTGAPGTGNITLGSASQGYQTFQQGGINNGDSFSYIAIDGNNWEYGIATYASSGNQLSRVVTKTSAQSTSPLALSSSVIITATLRAEDIQAANPTALRSLTDVQITEGPAINGYSLVWNNASSSWTASNIAAGGGTGGGGSNTFQGLTDVAFTEGPGIDGYLVKYNNSIGKWLATPEHYVGVSNNGILVESKPVNINFVNATSITEDNPGGTVTVTLPTGGGSNTLAGLSDVTYGEFGTNPPSGLDSLVYDGAGNWTNYNIVAGIAFHNLPDVSVSPGSGINGYVLYYNNAASLWEATPRTLANLTDVNVTEGSGIDGYSLVWNNATSKWIASNISGGGGSSLAIKNNGTSVDTAAVSLNFVNATSITTSAHAVTITLPSGGGGGGSGYGGNFVPPNFSTMTAETNLNSATVTSRTTHVDLPCIHVKPGSGSAGTLYGYMMAAPSGNFSLVLKAKTLLIGVTEDRKQGCGIMVRDTTSGWLSAALLNMQGAMTFTHTLGTGGVGTWSTGSADGKDNLNADELFLHVDWVSGTGLKLGVSRNGLDIMYYYTETNITNPLHVGICWEGSYGTIGGTGGIGPEYDFYHWFAGTLGSNGL